MSKSLHLKFLILLVVAFSLQVIESQANNQVADARDPNLFVATYSEDPSLLYSIRQQFAIDSDKIVTSPELQRISLEVDSVLSTDSVTSVDVTGYASIDGPISLNRRLAKGRADAMAFWLKKFTKVNPAMLSVSSNGEDWKLFESLVMKDQDMPVKSDVLQIIRSDKSIPQKQNALKALQNGKVWQYLAKNTFPEMRVAEVSLGGFHKIWVKIEQPPVVEEEVVMETVEEVIPEEPATEPATEYYTHKLYVKSNAPAWLCLWINAAVEYDLAPHWSVALPIYYSGFNYFTWKVKFRTFSVVPEIRWWPKADNTGFFLNAHLGMNLFNYAKGGDWRYQTYKGRTPALGGGIGLGFRWYFCKNHRWSMEAAVGAGIYHLDYSIFQNIHNGLIVGREKRTFYGIDQAALSFAYSFGVKKKEVRK